MGTSPKPRTAKTETNAPVSSGVTAEHRRMKEFTPGVPPWRRWGTFVAERSWGTVREDYSEKGDAWNHLTFDQSRSKAYRWGEDGIAGLCDRYQVLTFAPAFWNGRDPILKEKLFGVTPNEGNHGEDVKEYYFYLDNLPSHAYSKYLYKYPHAEYPYQRLIDENRARNGQGDEFELLDTGLFDEDRYFDVFIEYAKAAPEDILIRVEVFNRGPEAATFHYLPHLWFRNRWGWTTPRTGEPVIQTGHHRSGFVSMVADDANMEPFANLPFKYQLGKRFLYAEGEPLQYFTDNESNAELLYGVSNPSRHVKDAFHRHVIHGEACINPTNRGTKACFHYVQVIPAGKSHVFRLRLTPTFGETPFGREFEDMVKLRRQEADEFYETVYPPKASAEEKKVMRQAYAGLLWTKQIYLYDVNRWLTGDNPDQAPPASRWTIRNQHWRHLNSMRILSMPDKWEYPWFAAWDLAFHTIAFADIDIEYSKEMLWVMLFEQFQHPNGQIPAYEWEFSDLNPPVHAWAVWKVYTMDRDRTGKPDLVFLEKCFHKLLMNFAWWINKVDASGNNVFEGGFLGLDNITVVDRSEKLPDGATLEQSDATGWMGMFCLNLMRIAMELAKTNKVYEGLATKFVQHYIYVGAAMKNMRGEGIQLWDDEDGFFYDALVYPDGGGVEKFRVRSLVGLIPMYAIDILYDRECEENREFITNLDWFIRNRPDIVQRCVYSEEIEGRRRHVLSIVDAGQLKRLMERMCDPEEFLSPAGLRSMSRHHATEPFHFGWRSVNYEPAEAISKIKGGNSNWRGPIWFPTSYLMIQSLVKFSHAFGEDYGIDVKGEFYTPYRLAEELANRMINIFLPDDKGHRPVYKGIRKFQEDPHWKDYVLFYEYFHGDTGQGLGASHQTGWTCLIATLIQEWRK